MIFNILATGQSIKEYVHSGEPTIGVNDIYKVFPTKYLVCVDPPRVFSQERFDVIKNSTPKLFFSNVGLWHQYFTNKFHYIHLQSPRGNLDGLDGNKICYSISSPFVACVIAYKLGAKKIVLWGADYNNHKTFNSDKRKLEIVKRDFKNLQTELQKRNVKLMIGSSMSSLLLPVYQKD